MPSPKQHRWFPLLIFLGAAFTFSVTMIGTTMPTPLYPIYQDRFGFSDLMITIIFAAYAFGVISALSGAHCHGGAGRVLHLGSA